MSFVMFSCRPCEHTQFRGEGERERNLLREEKGKRMGVVGSFTRNKRILLKNLEGKQFDHHVLK